jgi:hypothetical protein
VVEQVEHICNTNNWMHNVEHAETKGDNLARLEKRKRQRPARRARMLARTTTMAVDEAAHENEEDEDGDAIDMDG